MKYEEDAVSPKGHGGDADSAREKPRIAYDTAYPSQQPRYVPPHASRASIAQPASTSVGIKMENLPEDEEMGEVYCKVHARQTLQGRH
jgi:hypothetical protein